ncbi:MAG: flagellar hook capping protein [Thermoleophilia bacterium]|nr:flagellar hook capping protein [Thermoleophilia bacterium]
MTTSTSAASYFVDPNGVQQGTRVVGMNEDQDVQKDMFLKLMIAQLRNQDPTAPMDQKDMMASMTQFSQIEQMQNMAKSMETLSLTQGVGMIGKQVSYQREIRDTDGTLLEVKTLTGLVDHVEQTGGSIKLVLQKPEGADDSVPAVTLSPSEVTRVDAS